MTERQVEVLDDAAFDEMHMKVGRGLFEDRLSERTTARQYFLLVLSLLTLLIRFSVVELHSVGGEVATVKILDLDIFRGVLGLGCVYAMAVYALSVSQDLVQRRYRQYDIAVLLANFNAANIQAAEEREKGYAARIETARASSKAGSEELAKIPQIREKHAEWRTRRLLKANIPIEEHGRADLPIIVEGLQDIIDMEQSEIDEVYAKADEIATAFTKTELEMAERLEAQGRSWEKYGNAIMGTITRSLWLARSRAALEIWVPQLFGAAAILVSIPQVFAWLSRLLGMLHP